MAKKIGVTCEACQNLVSLDELTEFQGELAELSKADFEKIKLSFVKYGISFAFSTWANKGKTYLIDGHARRKVLLAMREDGYEVPPVPVVKVQATSLKEAHEKLLLARSEYHKTTDDGLYGYLEQNELKYEELKEFIAPAGIDFDRFEANFYKENEEDAPDPQHDRAVKLQKKYGVRVGQIWGLKDHRLLCGDCRNAADVKRLYGKERAVLLNTDPPYGIAYDSAASKPGGHAKRVPWETIENDTLVDKDIQPFLEECFKSCKENMLTPNAAWYLWHAHLTGAFFAAAAAAAAAADVLLHRQIIWKKPRFIIGMGMYHWSHEPCFMGWVRGHKPPFYGKRNQDTVWSMDYDGKKNPTDRVHPTQKPVELFKIPIRNHTKPGEICAEPFSGSGSQIIAADQLGRRCYACEISPEYTAVAIQRWVDLTGGKPRLVK